MTKAKRKRKRLKLHHTNILPGINASHTSTTSPPSLWAPDSQKTKTNTRAEWRTPKGPFYPSGKTLTQVISDTPNPPCPCIDGHWCETFSSTNEVGGLFVCVCYCLATGGRMLQRKWGYCWQSAECVRSLFMCAYEDTHTHTECICRCLGGMEQQGDLRDGEQLCFGSYVPYGWGSSHWQRSVRHLSALL